MAIQAQFPSSGGSLDWLMDNGCGGFTQNFFNFHQPQQKQRFLQQQCNSQQLQNNDQQQRNHQNVCFDNSILDSSSPFKNKNTTNHPSMPYHRFMVAFQQKERQEIDHYLRLQNERLKVLLQEQRNQQLALVLKKVESKVVPLLKQKEEEIAQACKRKTELEEFLKRLEMENQGWQRVAQENEAMIISLNNTIEQLREKASGCFNINGAEDAESCCDENIGKTGETDENRGFFAHSDGDGEENATRMVCKVCNSRNLCILFLPCRHLCACKACEAFLDSCPVCQTVKKASIEALMV